MIDEPPSGGVRTEAERIFTRKYRELLDGVVGEISQFLDHA